MLNKTLKFEDIITLSRSSSATYWDANGVLQTAAPGEPRFDHDPVSGEPLGILIEEQRVNSLINSDGGLDAYATKAAVTLEEGPVPWLENGIRLDNDNGAEASYAYSTGANHTNYVEGDSVTMTVVLKMDDGGVPEVGSSSGDPGDFVVYMSVIRPASEVKVTPLLDNAYLLTATTVMEESTNNRFGLVKYTGASDRSLVMQVIQLEKGNFPTSYIPTNGAAATRNSDDASISYLTPWHRQKPGTFYVQMALSPFSEKGVQVAMNCNDTSSAEYNALIRVTAAGVGVVSRFDGAANASLQFSESNFETPYKGTKFAFSFEKDNFLASANGLPTISDSNGDFNTEQDLVQIGRGFGSWANGHIKAVRYYPYAMTEEELQELTA